VLATGAQFHFRLIDRPHRRLRLALACAITPIARAADSFHTQIKSAIEMVGLTPAPLFRAADI
jgi:hypothetical protein